MILSCRMLIPANERGQFDSMVMPFELEAYEILKSRSGKQECQSSPDLETLNPVASSRSSFDGI